MSCTYYSVMQFLPDLGRFEAVNVGVVVMNESASVRLLGERFA